MINGDKNVCGKLDSGSDLGCHSGDEVMRCDQIFGLNESATQLLLDNKTLLYTEQVTRVYPDGQTVRQEEDDRAVLEIPREKYDSYNGMFDNEYPLYEYTLLDGSVVQEYVQSDMWSSGPCIFLALRYKESKESVASTLWDQSEIDAA